jgi:hypothetical protein
MTASHRNRQDFKRPPVIDVSGRRFNENRRRISASAHAHLPRKMTAIRGFGRALAFSML